MEVIPQGKQQNRHIQTQAPEYCDVICRRYQKLTGQHPINQTTGEPNDFTTQEEQDE